MALSNAERQRRYRERKAAEQAKRGGDVRSDVTPAVTTGDVTPGAVELGVRGRRLWDQLTDDGPKLKPAERVLAEEACRTADRLDTLDRILRGDEDSWMSFRAVNEDGTVVSVQINNVLSEARQQQVALKALLAELRTSRTGGAARPGAGGKPTSTESVKEVPSGVLDLTARIGALQRQATG